jgi:archaeal flagellin FlaB
MAARNYGRFLIRGRHWDPGCLLTRVPGPWSVFPGQTGFFYNDRAGNPDLPGFLPGTCLTTGALFWFLPKLSRFWMLSRRLLIPDIPFPDYKKISKYNKTLCLNVTSIHRRLHGFNKSECMKCSQSPESAFTGLEAAIVLIAFIVVASVFAYMILSAGSSTTEKAQETVHSGISQTTSAVQPVGDVSIQANAAGTGVSSITFYLQVGPGGTGADMSTFSYTVSTPNGIWTFTSNEVTYSWVKEISSGGGNHGTHTGLLSPREMVLVTITKDFDSTVMGISTRFIVEVKPSTGAPVPIGRKVPDSMNANNWYVVY